MTARQTVSSCVRRLVCGTVLIALLAAPTAHAQQNDRAQTAAETTAEDQNAPASEPVFTLGPLPLLAPDGYLDEGDPSETPSDNDESGGVFTLGRLPLLPPEPPASEPVAAPAVPAAPRPPESRTTPPAVAVDDTPPAPRPASPALVIEDAPPAPRTDPPGVIVDDAPIAPRAEPPTLVVDDMPPAPSAQPGSDNAVAAPDEPAVLEATSEPATSTVSGSEPVEASSTVDASEPDTLLPSEPVTPPRTSRPRWSDEPVMEQVDVVAKRVPPPSPVKPSSGFTVSSTPPPGFEDLAVAQTTLVDVVYGRRVIVSTMATFDMGLLEFEDPLEILAQIPDAKGDEALINALTGPLDTHADQLCYSDYDTDCGTLTPEIAAVLFDEASFRATLFIHPDFLETQYLAESDYLPRSDSGPASVHAFSLSANGDTDNQLMNLSANSLVSYRETRLESQYDLDSEDGLSIDTLTLKHDARGWEVEAGAFRSRIQSAAFLTEQNLIGARVATSLNTRTDLRYAEATPLFAFLTERSRVDILRGEQLLDSRFYEAGNQQLDTSRLPDGAYNVTVRVAGGSSAQSTDYYFSRTSALPPKDQPLYFAEAGQLAMTRFSVLPELTDSYWLRAGTAHRLKDDFGIEASVSAIGDETLIESGLVWFRPGLQFQATALAGSSTGVSLRTVWQHDLMSLSADIRRISGDSALRVDDLELLPEQYTQANITASLPLWEGRLLAQGRWDKRGTRDFRSFGVNYSRELRRFARSNLNLTVDTTFSSDDNIIRLGVDWRWRDRGRDALIQPRFEHTSGSGSSALLNARYNHTLRNDVSGVYRASAYAEQTADRSTLGARFTAENARGVGDVELQYGVGGERPGAAYVANARFGVVSAGSEVAVGGRRASTSSIIIDIQGNAPDAVFEVMIGKQSHGYAQSGSRTLIALPPYETYPVRLISRDGELVKFDESIRSVTLYPGNVKTLNYTINRQIVVVGRVVDANGDSVANHAFVDLDGFASTDENGWFQIEITDPQALTLKRGEGSECVVQLPIEQTTESLIVLDEVVCQTP